VGNDHRPVWLWQHWWFA